MNLFANAQPVILKESSSAKEQLKVLESLRGTLTENVDKKLDADIRALNAGIYGEDQIMYELKNSHMNIVVLQDLYLEHEGLSAQIDFLVLSRQRNFVIECKNLYGNIEITKQGDFVRKFSAGKKEGIYSPITQNKRHLELIHAMKRSSRGAFLNFVLDSDFEDTYRSLVVLANPKTVLYDAYAPAAVKRQIIRADQLVATMQKINNEKGPGREKCAKSALLASGEWFLSQHKENPVDYTAKYKTLGGKGDASAVSCGEDASLVVPRCPKCGAEMVLRTAKSGPRSGKQFWGCSTYPACKGIVNVE